MGWLTLVASHKAVCSFITAGGDARVATVNLVLLGSLACFHVDIAASIVISAIAVALVNTAIYGSAAVARAYGVVQLACMYGPD